MKDSKSVEFINLLNQLSLRLTKRLKNYKLEAPKRILGDYIGDRIIGLKHILPFNVFYDSRV